MIFVAQGPLENEAEIRLQLTYLLAPQFMTPNASMTLPDTIQKDASLDAFKLKSAVDAVLRTL